MKKTVKDLLICPTCLPDEIPLELFIDEVEDDDIISGILSCKKCSTRYKIEEGIAVLVPTFQTKPDINNKYENPKVVSSYLWSHYGDFLNDEEWLPAYLEWANIMNSSKGISLDIGCAAGRFTFEMAEKSELSVGIDLSFAFIKTARELMKKREISFELTEEGNISRPVTIKLSNRFDTNKVEFLIADALFLPFPKSTFTKISSLNVIDKVPYPMNHLQEMNRVATPLGSQILISDPYSWSEEVAKVEHWLGGKSEGQFSGYGQDNIAKILEGHGNFIDPPWKVIDKGTINWKIRNHRNHSELIKSLYIKGIR